MHKQTLPRINESWILMFTVALKSTNSNYVLLKISYYDNLPKIVHSFTKTSYFLTKTKIDKNAIKDNMLKDVRNLFRLNKLIQWKKT